MDRRIRSPVSMAAARSCNPDARHPQRETFDFVPVELPNVCLPCKQATNRTCGIPRGPEGPLAHPVSSQTQQAA